MSKGNRDRLQVDLTSGQRHFLQTLGDRLGGAGDAETTRRVLEVVEDLTANIERGFKVVVVPADDERPDALPELSRAFRPDVGYTYLVSRPHAWRRQLVFKGKRLTVGQFLHNMRANELSAEAAAADFELPVDAAYEAMDYGQRFADLIAADEAEDAAAARKHLHAAVAG